MQDTINGFLQGLLFGSVFAMIGFLLLAWSMSAEGCETKYKWVCTGNGVCEWISVCE